MTGEIYVGVDSCPKGWFFTVITDGAGCETGIAPDINCLWNKFNSAAQILIDIPIGLAYNSRRLFSCHRYILTPKPPKVTFICFPLIFK